MGGAPAQAPAWLPGWWNHGPKLGDLIFVLTPPDVDCHQHKENEAPKSKPIRRLS